MGEKVFSDVTSLVIVANEFPNRLLAQQMKKAHEGQYFREIYLRWRDLFDILPRAGTILWHEKIDFDDPDLFYNTMRMVVESDATPPELYEDIVAATDGLTIRWKEFLDLVPNAAKIDWFDIADDYPSMEPGGDDD
ncbi:hypothetical protein KQI63_08050 [bacterium]|nr:hypothetical protein [bacterium]